MRNPTKSPTTANALPVKYKVQITEGLIVVDGATVGYFNAYRGEVWMDLLVNGERKFFARVKHLRSASNKAKTMVKDILSRLTPAEYLAEHAKPTKEPVDILPNQTKSPYEIQTEVLGFATTRAYHEEVFGPLEKRFPQYKTALQVITIQPAGAAA